MSGVRITASAVISPARVSKRLEAVVLCWRTISPSRNVRNTPKWARIPARAERADRYRQRADPDDLHRHLVSLRHRRADFVPLGAQHFAATFARFEERGEIALGSFRRESIGILDLYDVGSKAAARTARCVVADTRLDRGKYRRANSRFVRSSPSGSDEPNAIGASVAERFVIGQWIGRYRIGHGRNPSGEVHGFIASARVSSSAPCQLRSLG